VKNAQIYGEHAKHENIENNPEDDAIRIHTVSVPKKELSRHTSAQIKK
jgi:hypothetical protein